MSEESSLVRPRTTKEAIMPSFNDGFVHLFPPILDDNTYLMIEVKSITVGHRKEVASQY